MVVEQVAAPQRTDLRAGIDHLVGRYPRRAGIDVAEAAAPLLENRTAGGAKRFQIKTRVDRQDQQRIVRTSQDDDGMVSVEVRVDGVLYGQDFRVNGGGRIIKRFRINNIPPVYSSWSVRSS